MSEEGTLRIWAKLDEMTAMLTRILAVQDEREKNCVRHESELDDIDKRVHKLEIGLAKWAGLAALVSSLLTAVLTAGAIRFFVR